MEIQCPKCGGKEIGKGKQAGYAAVTPLNSFFKTGSPIIHSICLSCGFIVESYVENPSKFKD
ncbi:transcription initiation factor TFIIIB [Paenibacillus radicis (ex Xue et al. 2023)]|uniref:Transcription initiation factor TFIIIB n=1 Tax=Paenibacillus radicis (ex Xue et al. 2023) TaxID=2972489 RepID=A0ABT1YK31_9BACL|nr:transcription initiation factor TFIIIB [Paenibacillus radicis (ex Xue et al. 2023)]MCR8633531.1 transcription initiation factor TFIIIB [Paenibacillus radicis (ex Xue et al. 2023)]